MANKVGRDLRVEFENCCGVVTRRRSAFERER
jgi:hypothetical protein